ncbi:MAG: nucleoside deaminase [Gemmatimonadota bacterium]
MSDTGRTEFMREAIRLAAESVETGEGGPFGAVVVRDGRIIARGRNRVTSSFDPTAHAEIEAIRAACRALGSFQLEGCEIYCSAEPCPMCLGAIYWARPARVYYAAARSDAAAVGFDDAFIYEEIRVHPAERRIPLEPLLPEEGLEPLAAWSRKADRIEY